MRGVAGDENAPAPPALCHQSMEPVGGGAPQLALAGRHETGKQAPDLLRHRHLPRVFARQQHDLPAPVIARPDDGGGGPRRVAELRRALRQPGQRRFAAAYIHHQPGLIENQVAQRHIGQLAHGAGGAIAAEQEFAADLALRAIFCAQCGADLLASFLEADQFRAGDDADSCETRRMHAHYMRTATVIEADLRNAALSLAG